MHAGERVACSVAYADAQALQHAVSSLDAARTNSRGVGDSVTLQSCKVVTACAGERALHAGERLTCNVAYADAQAQQHAVIFLRCR